MNIEVWNRYLFLRQIIAALAWGTLIAIVLPLISAVLFGAPLLPTLTVIGSGFLLEYGAAPVGIALGLTPLFVFWVLMCTEIGFSSDSLASSTQSDIPGNQLQIFSKSLNISFTSPPLPNGTGF